MLSKLNHIILFFLKPLKKIFHFIFKYFTLPVYKLFYLTKKQIKQTLDKQIQNRLILVFTHSYLLYILIIISSLAVLINNLTIKTASAEDLGKKSLLYQLAQGDEFEEIIIEESLIIERENQIMHSIETQPDLESQKNDFLEPSDVSLTKTEAGTGKLATTTLQETTIAGGIADDVLLKTNSPATFSSPQPREKIQEYVVQAGDTISSIAEKFNISINTVLWANNLSGLSIIRPNDKLTILPLNGVLHKVKKGDTISGIAKEYNVSQDKILSYNKLINDDQLSISQDLIIPDGEIKTIYTRTTGGFSSIFGKSSSQKKAGGFIWPTVSRHITQYYHWRHHAIDIGGQTGSPIYASLDGRVVEASWTQGYGYNIIIDHGGGKKTLYAHLSKMYVQAGEQVTQGTNIGALGSTGWSTGPHLHFEIIINGARVNPLSYL